MTDRGGLGLLSVCIGLSAHQTKQNVLGADRCRQMFCIIAPRRPNTYRETNRKHCLHLSARLHLARDRAGRVADVLRLSAAQDCYSTARWEDRKKAGYRCDDFPCCLFRQPCSLSARPCLISSTRLHVRSLVSGSALDRQVIRWPGTSALTRPGVCRPPVACTSVHRESAPSRHVDPEPKCQPTFRTTRPPSTLGPTRSPGSHILPKLCPARLP